MGPSDPQSINSWLQTHADHQPGKTALRCEGQEWSYGALSARVDELATILSQDFELEHGDRLAMLGHNCAAQVMVFFAAAKIGVIVVPLNWRLADQEINAIMSDCAPKFLLFGDEMAPRIDAILAGPEVVAVSVPDLEKMHSKQPVFYGRGQIDDPLLIVYTSGTTGHPKGVVISQHAILWNAISSLHMHEFTASDHVLNVLPLFHVGGINIQMMPALFVGATTTLMPSFDPPTVLRALENDGITTSVFVPTVMRALLALEAWGEAKLPNLRLLVTGSTDVPVDILAEINKRGIPFIQVYGATETGPVTIYQRAQEALSSIGSLGRAGAHCNVRVARKDGQICEVGETGEIWVKAPNLFSHYWNEPKATSDAMSDGWFKTGDLAYQCDRGLYWFVGRSKHVIISGGENIYPAEIERLLRDVPGVQELCVVGKPDEKWGAVPVIVAVVDQDGPTAQALLAVCQGKIARFKQPKDVKFVDALPKNALGKVILSEVVQSLS